MQALIDFDGWRRWKDFADKTEDNESASKLSVSYQSIAPRKTPTTLSPTSAANLEANGIKKDEEKERKSKRKSLSVVPPPVLPEEAETPPPELDSSDS
jgi:osomolarity two-component system response regulator SSK1